MSANPFDQHNALPVGLRRLILRHSDGDLERAARHLTTVAERLGLSVDDHALWVVLNRAGEAGWLFTDRTLSWIKADGDCALWLAFPAEMTQAVTIRADERRGAGRFAECSRIERELQERLGARVAA
jgi:hypothetical protein